LNETSYWTSRRVVVPERIHIDHILSDDPAEALSARRPTDVELSGSTN
jgi:hypothetical protein